LHIGKILRCEETKKKKGVPFAKQHTHTHTHMKIKEDRLGFSQNLTKKREKNRRK